MKWKSAMLGSLAAPFPLGFNRGGFASFCLSPGVLNRLGFVCAVLLVILVIQTWEVISYHK